MKAADRSIFTDSRLTIEEIEEGIEAELRNSRFFPFKASIWVKGDAVFEGFFIEKVSQDEYKLHSQRHLGTNPFQLADKTEELFEK